MINKKGALYISIPLLIISIITVLFFTTDLVFSATHTSTANLTPQWSVLGVTNPYEVKILNIGGSSIDEIRIIQNPEYSDLSCNAKANWNLIFVPDFPDPEFGIVDICWYFTNDANAIVEGNYEIFKFNATAPSVVSR